MHKIRYIPYPVVNLIFDKPVFNHGYDTWCPGNTFTDFIVADWVIQKQAGYQQKFNIISCYTPMTEENRGYLLNEIGARKIAANVLTDFQKLMPGFNVDPVEVHIYRRGHPLYMSTPGLYTRVQPLVRQSMDRVFFANTDSEGPESTTNRGNSCGAACSERSGGAAGGKTDAEGESRGGLVRRFPTPWDIVGGCPANLEAAVGLPRRRSRSATFGLVRIAEGQG